VTTSSVAWKSVGVHTSPVTGSTSAFGTSSSCVEKDAPWSSAAE
jgi:hypothetical protein